MAFGNIKKGRGDQNQDPPPGVWRGRNIFSSPGKARKHCSAAPATFGPGSHWREAMNLDDRNGTTKLRSRVQVQIFSETNGGCNNVTQDDVEPVHDTATSPACVCSVHLSIVSVYSLATTRSEFQDTELQMGVSSNTDPTGDRRGRPWRRGERVPCDKCR